MRITTPRKGRYARRMLRSLIVTWALVVGLHLLPGASPVAHASIGPCATDPLFVLSNGTELDVDTLIAAASADIGQVVFTIHVPSGTQIVLYVAGSLGSRESWRIVADEPLGSYTTIARASSTVSNISVQATTQIIGLIGAPIAIVNGEVNQDLTAHLTVPGQITP